MADNRQNVQASIDQALRKASLTMFAPDRETLLRTAISLREKAVEKAISHRILEPA